MNINIIISDEVKNLGIKGIFLQANNLTNCHSNSDFEEIRNSVIDSAISAASNNDFASTDKILLGYRNLHTRVSVNNKKNISSPENLYNFVRRNNSLPHINLLVDIYNVVSLKYKLALGAHDIDHIIGNVNLRLTNGDETYIPLGASGNKMVKSGEYAYIDDSNEVLCYLEVRQVEKTKIGIDAKNCFYIIQGNEFTNRNYLESCMEELVALTKKYCGGDFKIIGSIY